MKIRFSYLLIVILSLSKVSISQGIDAYFYSSPFYAPGVGAYLETYIAVAGNSVNYLMTEDSTLQASIEVTMLFKNDDEIKEFRKYNFVSPPLQDTATVFPSFIDLQRIMIPSGVYNFELIVHDNYGPDTLPDYEYIDIITLDFPENIISFSGIQLLESFTPQTRENIFVKNGYECVPFVSSFYPNQINYLKFYCELYNAAKELGPLEDFLFMSHIEKQNTGKPIAEMSSFSKEKAMNANVFIKDIDISKLPTGNYYLLVEVRNRENKVVLSKRKFFQRMNTEFEPSDSIIVKDVKIENTFAQKFVNIDSLKFFMRSLKPISDENEIRFIENQINSNELVYMQQFFYSFWAKRNESYPELAWDEYYLKVVDVQNKFGSKLHPGFLTDRGRVYLQYGPPSSIVKELNESNAYPYEIWHYYKIADQTNKKFIFYNRDFYSNNFTLLHSNMVGELNNPTWENELYSRTGAGSGENRAKQIFEDK